MFVEILIFVQLLYTALYTVPYTTSCTIIDKNNALQILMSKSCPILTSRQHNQITLKKYWHEHKILVLTVVFCIKWFGYVVCKLKLGKLWTQTFAFTSSNHNMLFNFSSTISFKVLNLVLSKEYQCWLTQNNPDSSCRLFIKLYRESDFTVPGNITRHLRNQWQRKIVQKGIWSFGLKLWVNFWRCLFH